MQDKQIQITSRIHRLVDKDRIPKEKIQEWEEFAFPRYRLIPKWICRRYVNWLVKCKYKRYLNELHEIKKEVAKQLSRRDNCD